MWIVALALTALADEPAPPPIINGDDASEEDYPMAGGALFDADIGSSYYRLPMLMCSSTLIAPDVVLLAAHCVDLELLEYYFPGLRNPVFSWSRQADLSQYDGTRDVAYPVDAIEAVDFAIHESYSIHDYGMGLTHNDDVALLFLSEPVFDVPYAYVPTLTEAEQLEVDKEVVVVGWGQQTDATSPPAGTYGVKQMGVSFISEIAEWEMKIGERPDDVRKCHGDSGGPSFMDVEADTTDKMRVVGVTSHAYDKSDCRRTGGVDTRVDAYLDWIDGEMRAACADGTRVWCEQEGIIYAEDDEEPDPGDDTGATDTGSLADDTGAHRPPGAGLDDDDDEDLSGCACSTGAASGLPWAALLLPLALVRRR